MFCKICKEEVTEAFYKHLNSRHKTTIPKYFDQYPDQKEEYEKMKKPQWCKGLTKNADPRLAKSSEKIKETTSTPEVRKERSERLKERYKEHGDILTPEQRAVVVKLGNDGWVNKIKNLSKEERKKFLKNFTSAGNEAQKEIRKKWNPTPEEWMKKYPFGLGEAKNLTCENCEEEFIGWVGGRPRPIKKFCREKCKKEFLINNPFYRPGHGKIKYKSKKSGYEFRLDSNLELAMATYFDKEEKVKKWIHSPLAIPYITEKKKGIITLIF